MTAELGASRDLAIRVLWRARSRNRLLHATLWGFLLLVALCVATGFFAVDDLFTERRRRNLGRFLSELVPLPLRENPDAGVGDLLLWVWNTFADKGALALAITVAISISAIALAGLLGAIASPFVARNLATDEPFLPGPRASGWPRRAAWRAWLVVARGALVFLRAVPEYVIAFLLVTMFGLGAMPAVLALGLHNAGILGRLGGEVLENVDPTAPRALRALGASRRQILVASMAPAALPRLLAYFFYRWETCLREATVLGTLGLVSLGYRVQEARSAQNYDEMVFLVALAALVVFLGDLVSTRARRHVRDVAS